MGKLDWRIDTLGWKLIALGVLGAPAMARAQTTDLDQAEKTTEPLEVLTALDDGGAHAGSTDADADATPLRPERAVPSGTTISREAVREIPGALDDPARAVDVLPGQAWLVSGLPYAMVRGQPPDNTGYFFDGIRLPLVFHFGVGPGVFPASLVDHVDFYAGAAPAQFGRAAGAVVSMEPACDPQKTETQVAARLYDAGGSVRTPFAEGRGMAWIGGRYAYSAAIASLFSNQYKGWYGDYHAKAEYYVTPTDRVGILALGAYDRLDEESSSGVEPVVTTQFHRADLRYDKWFDERTRARVAVQLGRDRSGGINDQYVTDRTLSARMEVAHRLTDAFTFWWGADFQRDSISTEGSETADRDTQAFLVDRVDSAFGAYLSASFRPSDAFEANWGVRADAYRSGDAEEAAVDPRASVRAEVASGVRVLGAGGISHQPPSVLFALPGVRVANLPDGLQRSVQASAGAEADLTPEWTASLVGFRHWNHNTSDFFGALTTPYFIPEVLTRTDGTTTGAELSARGRIGKDIGAYLAYTLSRSTRKSEGRSFVSSFDRTHVGTAMATYEAGRSWRVGGRLTVVSGVPRNDPAKLGTEDENERVGPYFRLDGRAEKRWLWDGEIPIAVYFEVMNVTANRETVLSDCEESGCLKAEKVGPVIVPNIGAEMFF